MITNRDVVEALETANARLISLWPTLSALTGEQAKKDGIENVAEFQLQLFDTIAELEQTYRIIVQEEKKRTENRGQYSPRWFRCRMRTLKRRKSHVAEMLSVCRSFGDMFAWWFYENDREMIAQHQSKQRQKLLPPGAGRAGERATLENMQVIDGKLLLHHGITDFLRIGDFSVIDLASRRCVGLVEAKTSKPENNSIGIRLNFLSGTQLDFSSLRPKNSQKESSDDSSMFEVKRQTKQRLERQIDEMRQTIAPIEPESLPDVNLPIESKNHYASIREAMDDMNESKAGFSSTNEGNLFIAVPTDPRTRLNPAKQTSNERLNRVFLKMPGLVSKIVIPGRKDNSIELRTLNHWTRNFGTERLPLQWWPIGSDNVRRILCGEAVLISAYNPAHFSRCLEEDGFQIERGDSKQASFARKTLGSKQLRFEAFSYFLSDLAVGNVSLTAIRQMLTQVCDFLSSQEEGNHRANMKFMMHRYKPASIVPSQ